MKKALLILLISIIQLNFLTAQNKDFVGRILYKNVFFTPTGVNITAKVSPALGAEQDYYTNANNYKSVLNGSAMFMQLYSGLTNKYYIVLPNKTAQEIDGSTVSDSVINVQHVKSDTLILGRKCKTFVMTTLQSVTTYFYDPTLKVNKENFKMHEYGNWNRYLQESNGALPIKYTVKTKMFTWDAEAIKIEEMNLVDKDFELSSDIIIKK